MAKTTDLSFRLDSASSEELKTAIDQIIKEGGESDPRLKNYRRFYLAAKNRENKAAKTPAPSATPTPAEKKSTTPTEETTVTKTEKTPATAKKPSKAAKAAAPKKGKKEEPKGKKTPAAKKTPSANGRERKTNTNLSPIDRRWACVEALKKLGATSSTAAVTADAVAEKTKLTRFDVYGQFYFTHLLQTEGFVEQVKHEGSRGLSYYLTKKGVKAKKEDLA